MEEKETITVIDKDGIEKVAEVIATFNIEKFNKDYIIYTFNEPTNNEMIKVYTATLVEKDNEYSFEAISTDEEWEEIKKFMKELAVTNQEQ